MKVDGNIKLKEHSLNLVKLVASTSIWASPIIVKKLQEEPGNENASWYSNARRWVAKTEIKKSFVNGVFIDTNTKANNAIKAALGFGSLRPKNYTACHIYEGSVKYCEYYTAIPNIILVPSPLYAITDHLDECKAFLKYYSYYKYGFRIKKVVPHKPDFFDKVKELVSENNDQRRIDTALKSIQKRKSTIEAIQPR